MHLPNELGRSLEFSSAQHLANNSMDYPDRWGRSLFLCCLFVAEKGQFEKSLPARNVQNALLVFVFSHAFKGAVSIVTIFSDFLREQKMAIARAGVADISSRIAGPGELFSSDFRACARSPRWETRCSFGLLNQLQLRCSNSITGPQASSSRSELSAK